MKVQHDLSNKSNPFCLFQERGVLKEANLEKKLQIALKETEILPSSSDGNLPKSRKVASKVSLAFLSLTNSVLSSFAKAYCLTSEKCTVFGARLSQ